MNDSSTSSIFGNTHNKLQIPSQISPSELAVADPISLKNLLKELNRLRMSGTYCDAILATEDGGRFWVHKVAMSWCSSYFRTLFTTTLMDKGCGEGSSSRNFFLIPKVSSSVLGTIIMFAYSGITAVTKDNVNELLPAADQFSVLDIVEECIDFILKNIALENCIGVWRFGEQYYMPRLEKEAFRFILSHFVDVSINSEEFLHLKVNHLMKILKDDTLNAPNEMFVWIAIKRWCQYKYRKRLSLIPSLFPCVRMPFLSINDFTQIMNDPRVFRHEQCKPFIEMVTKYILNEHHGIHRKDVKKEIISIFTPRHPYEIIIVSGGWTLSGPTNIIEAYDCRADLWKMIFMEEFGPRAYHQMVSLGGYVYVIGGNTGQAFLNSCLRFHTSNLQLEEIAPMQEQRCFLSATHLNDRIYAIGGFNGFQRLRTVEYYDHTQNQWLFVSPMNQQRSDASASSLRNRIFIVGGFDGNDFLRSAECYFNEYDQWFFLPPMITCRSGVGCVAVDNTIYAIGGFDGEHRLNSVEKYSLFHRQWFPTKPMKLPRSNFAVTIMEKKIYVIGGYDDAIDDTTDQSECFDLSCPQWSSIAPLNVGRSGFSTCTFSGIKDITQYIKDDRFRCLLRNASREEMIDLEAEEDEVPA